MADEEQYLTAAVRLLEDDGGEENSQQAARAGQKEALAKAGGQSKEEKDLLLMLFEAALSGHRQAAGETNEWGMGVLDYLKPGRYYLFGFTRTERETLVWHLPLKIRAGNNELELDQYNTANIFES